MELHLKIIGVLLMLLALIHVVFPKYFKWKEELSSLSLFNRQMMQVHTFFIALTVFLMGALCYSSSMEIVSTELGKKLALGLAIFWSIRAIFQFFIYSTKLWKGKIFETSVHVIFSLFWVYLSTSFWFIYFEKSF